jgi:hypothetical protein
MDTEQREFYDRHGYVVVKNAIPLSLVARLNRDYDQKVREAYEADSSLGEKPGQHNFRESRDHLGKGVRLWSQAWEELVDPPKLLPIIAELMNDDHFGHSSPGVPPSEHRGKFRLDHDNIHFRPGALPDDGGGLHTGHGAKECRLLSVVYELAPVKPGQGGFGCLPGSHRDDAPPLPTHDGWRKPGNWATPEQRGALWPEDVPVHRIEAGLGDAIVFTEKLIHGTLPWAGGGERRTLFCARASRMPVIVIVKTVCSAAMNRAWVAG